MTERVQHLLDQVMTLTPTERAELLTELQARFDAPSEMGAEEAWAREIERRIARAERGETVGTDWETVRDRLEKKLRGR